MPELVRCTCSRINDPWRRYCGGCGAMLPHGCSSCGFVNNSHDRYCGGCGTRTAHAPRLAPPPAPQPQPQTIPLEIIDEVR